MNIISKAICISYSYENTCILTGAVDEDRNVILWQEIFLQNASVEHIQNLIVDKKEGVLKKILDDNSENIPSIWSNKNKFLATALSSYLKEQIDFDNEQKQDFDAVNDLYSELLKSQRIFKAEGVKMQNTRSKECFKMMLWAIGEDTIQKEKAVFFIDIISREENINDIFRGW